MRILFGDLRGNEQFVASNAARADTLADTLLGPVFARGVNVPIARLDRRGDEFGRSMGQFHCTEPDRWHSCAMRFEYGGFRRLHQSSKANSGPNPSATALRS